MYSSSYGISRMGTGDNTFLMDCRWRADCTTNSGTNGYSGWYTSPYGDTSPYTNSRR